MGAVAKTLAIGSVLGAGYVALRLADAWEQDDAREPTSSVAQPVASSSSRPRPSSPAQSVRPMPSEMVKLTLPLAEPSHPKLKQRINRSTVDDAITVRETPAELLTQARRYDPHVTLDELTGARLAASEHESGTFPELCCIVDAEVNRARRRRKSLYASLTYKDTFGKQGKIRRAATRRDPRMRHLLAARAVLSGPARGISRGAKQFYDPRAQLAAHRRWLSKESPRRHCHPLVILERWAFDLPWAKGKGQCKLDRARPGRHKLEWVGPIPGVNPYRLLLMRMATVDHQAMYEAARKLIAGKFPINAA